jgi:hypothetical protein
VVAGYGRRLIAQPFSVVHGRYLRSIQIVIADLARFFRPLIIPPPREGCLSQLLVFGPFGERRLTDEFGSDPLDLFENFDSCRRIPRSSTASNTGTKSATCFRKGSPKSKPVHTSGLLNRRSIYGNRTLSFQSFARARKRLESSLFRSESGKPWRISWTGKKRLTRSSFALQCFDSSFQFINPESPPLYRAPPQKSENSYYNGQDR